MPSAKDIENRVILLVGPTGVGKTGAAVELALRLGTEIVGADSMQIYRHMDIGTEKPASEELRGVTHHMLDVAEPSERMSVGRYLELAVPIIEGLHASMKIPIIAGGTGLYIKAMTRGLFEGPSADEVLREELHGRSTESLYKELSELDPDAANTIKPGDKRRMVRALEVCRATGERFSALQKELTQPLPWDFVKIALTRERKELYKMIDARVDEMMARGLLDEVRRVMEMHPSETPMQAIGYKELAAHLAGEYPLDEAVRLIKRNTRRYAKRQYTWFRKEEGLQWVDISGVTDPEEALARIIPVLARSGIAL